MPYHDYKYILFLTDRLPGSAIVSEPESWTMKIRLYLLKIAILALIGSSAADVQLAQRTSGQPEPPFDFYTRGPYNAKVPSPQSLLRYDVGSHHTTYAQMEEVIRSIAAAAPDRVKVFDIGLTNEYRMQHLVAISSPENIARLDQIKETNSKLADPRGTTQSEANAIAARSPVIAWMAYTIHGNESASFEAMMQVVYQLAASNEERTLDILRNTVVLVLTGENPDGHERFVTWYNSVGIGDPNRYALEHREPWSIYGRLSHYRFDLNRDTLATTQVETQNMQRAYLAWNPQVAVDHHGQPSQFFFPPTALPINPNLPQPVTGEWNKMFGAANAKAFDSNNWDYYVRDVYDAFYPGYWDMYPSLNGAIGMTYETDGGGTKGLAWTRDDGTIVTLRSAIAKHFVASMSTLAVAADNRERRLKDFYDFRASGMAAHRTAKLKRVVILPDKDRVKAAELIDVLLRSRIEVKVASQSFSSTTAHSYMRRDAPAESRTFPAGSYIVDLDQPQRILIKAILEQDTPQDKAFVDDNMGRFRRNQMKGAGQAKEDYGFYDITAWSLPLAFGLDAYWTEASSSVSARPATEAHTREQQTGSFPTAEKVASYILPYDTDSTGPLVIRLLQRNFKVAVATRQLSAAGRMWPAGTFVVRVTRNTDAIHAELKKLALEMGVRVTAASTGFTDEGDTGIGGEAVLSLQQPKIAMVADEAVDQTSFGSIWWTFDRYGVRFTPMSIRGVKNGGLRGYNVLILPDGSPGMYFSMFGKDGIETLRNFVREGGTIVTARGASVFAALKDTGLTSTKLVGSDDEKDHDDDRDKPAPSPTPASSTAKKAPAEKSPNPSSEELVNDKADGAAPALPPIASPSADANKVPVALPGSIMRATVDRTTWLSYGLQQNDLPVLLASGYFFRYSKEGSNALVFDATPTRPLTISGFVWEGNTERLLAGTSYIIDEPEGAGHVVLFAEEPFFRGIFRSTTRPFFNAIAFTGVF